MANRRQWKKPTPEQEYRKAMYELDKWIKDDMIASADIIEKNIQRIIKEKANEMQ